MCGDDGMVLQLKGRCVGWGMMVCDDDEMFYLHILARLLENRRKTWCLMYVRVVPARKLVYVAFFA